MGGWGRGAEVSEDCRDPTGRKLPNSGRKKEKQKKQKKKKKKKKRERTLTRKL